MMTLAHWTTTMLQDPRLVLTLMGSTGYAFMFGIFSLEHT